MSIKYSTHNFDSEIKIVKNNLFKNTEIIGKGIIINYNIYIFDYDNCVI